MEGDGREAEHDRGDWAILYAAVFLGSPSQRSAELPTIWCMTQGSILALKGSQASDCQTFLRPSSRSTIVDLCDNFPGGKTSYMLA